MASVRHETFLNTADNYPDACALPHGDDRTIAATCARRAWLRLRLHDGAIEAREPAPGAYEMVLRSGSPCATHVQRRMNRAQTERRTHKNAYTLLLLVLDGMTYELGKYLAEASFASR